MLNFVRPLLKKVVINVVLLVAVLSLLELFFLLILRWPSELSARPLVLFGRGVYLNNRDIIQYNSDCARFDPELTYTLRPGVCRFTGAEFDVEVSVNSVGFRDDELSLRAPQVVVVGDSHAMGWGIEAEESFPSRLEAATGLRVLNTAISSYGTLREGLLLARVDRSSLKVLIVQYCPNDYWENASVGSGASGSAMSEPMYRSIVDHFDSVRSYRFGEYLTRSVEVQVFNRIRRWFVGLERLPDPTGPAPRAPDPGTEAAAFLRALSMAPPDVFDLPVIVIAIDAFGRVDYSEPFIAQLRESRRSMNLQPLQIHGLREERHFFQFDDHLNAAGHELVAKQLLRHPAIIEAWKGHEEE